MRTTTLLLFFLFAFAATSQKLSRQDSLLLDRYYAAGMPSLSRDWSPSDFKTAVETIVRTNKNKSLALPTHKNSTRLILNKLTDFDNYWVHKSQSFTETKKTDIFIEMSKPITELMLCYLAEGNNEKKKLKYSYEVTACMVTILKLMDKIMVRGRTAMANEATLNQTQKNGLTQFRNGLNTSAAGMFETLERDYVFYEMKDVCNLSGEFFKFYKMHRDVMDPDSRNEFDRRRINLTREGKLECIKKAASQ